MKRYVIIYQNKIITSVMWDGVTAWNYPFPHDEVVQSDELQIGMIKEGDVWVMPPPPIVEDIEDDLNEEMT